MSNLVGSIAPFVNNGNFRAYEDQIRKFIKDNNIPHQVLTAFFITIAGSEIQELLISLTAPDVPNNKSFDELMTLLRNYFTSKENKRSERYKFFTANQEEGEEITEYIERLKMLAGCCHFGDFISRTDTHMYKEKILDEALCDRFIIGLRNKKIQQALLKELNLNFNELTTKAINMELLQKAAQILKTQFLQTENESNDKQTVSYDSHTHKECLRNVETLQNSNNKCCSNCPLIHSSESCALKMYSWESFKSQKIDHITLFCQQDNNQNSRNIQNDKDKNIIYTFESEASNVNCGQYIKKIPSVNKVGTSNCQVGNIQNTHNSRKHKSTDIMENKTVQSLECILLINEVKTSFQVNTKSEVTIMNEDEYNLNFKYIKLEKNCNNLCIVLENVVEELGSAMVQVDNGNGIRELKLTIVCGSWPSKAILGRNWINILYPNWSENYIGINCNNNGRESLVTDIKKCIQKINATNKDGPIIGYSAKLVIKKQDPPIFHTSYIVPYELRDEVEKEIRRLIEVDILQPIKNSKWATPVVVVIRPNGELHLCMDFKVTINRFITFEDYPLPNISNILTHLDNSKYFCVIDLKKAYQQLCVDDISQELLVINTHIGLFAYKRLPFGLSCAPSIFQSVMDKLLLGLSKVFFYLEDIIIGGDTLIECRNNLYSVLSRLNYHNVKINIDKSKFLVTHVKYLGHVISEQGIMPNPEKIEALLDAPSPKDKKQLRPYLGLISYYLKINPKLFSKLLPLYDLLDGPHFTWTEECQATFETSKKILLNNDVLEIYDPNKPIIIDSDASPYGIGAILMHKINNIEKPIMFVSSTLSDAERNYSKLHREALAIIFALQKFHNYIYGRNFTLYINNKELKELFNPKKTKSVVANTSLQRWSVIMSMYKYNIQFRNVVGYAAAMSYLPINYDTGIEPLNPNYLEYKSNILNVEIVKNHIKHDEELYQVYKNLYNKNWKSNAYTNLENYEIIQLNLSLDKKCVFYGRRLIIPKCLRKTCLKILHKEHRSEIRMRTIARSYVWWPSLYEDIEIFIKACKTCN